MIKSIRMRHIEKPIITQQIIYNHQQELLESNSDMSFLKLSQNTSKQLNIPDSDHFSALQTHLNQLTERSKLKINCLQSNIKCLERGKDYCLPRRSNSDLPYQQILDQNKQNVRMTYCKLAYVDEPENMQDCNFQMDQNRNYVKNMILHSRNRDSAVKKEKVSSRDCYSLQNSRKLSQKEIFYEQNSFGCTKRKFSENLSRNSQNTAKRSMSASKSKAKNSSRSSSKVSNKSSVQENDFKRGRIYEQILSHYSIPRLLAMQPKLKEKRDI